MSTDDLGPLPRIHPRVKPCNEARQAIEAAIAKAVKEHELTTAEEISVINGACSSCIGHIAKYAIRHERHGDKDRPGGWA